MLLSTVTADLPDHLQDIFSLQKAYDNYEQLSVAGYRSQNFKNFLSDVNFHGSTFWQISVVLLFLLLNLYYLYLMC